MLQGAKTKQMYYVPGEHDNATDDGKEYLARFGKGTKGTGWYSFDHHGVHFVGLVNSAALEGMGKLGADQLAWLKDDLSGRSSSTPDRHFRAHSLVERVSGVGLGHRRQ